jgi:hypothetical protein
MAAKGRPYFPATAAIEQKEHNFQAFYRTLVESVSEKHLKPESALELVMKEYKKLQADSQISSSCVYAEREKEMHDEIYLAAERAMLGMDDSATKSLAQLAEEQRKPSKASWLVPVGSFTLAFVLSALSGDRSRVPDCEQRAPGSIRHDPYRHPQYLIDDAPKKEPEKTENDSVPRWE